MATLPSGIVQNPSPFYGIPQGMAGRTVDSVLYPIAGIVLHCIDGTINNYISCDNGQTQNHQSFHYTIGNDGVITQFVDDNNIAWSMRGYTDGISDIAPLQPISWEPLTSTYPNISSDIFTINIGLENIWPQNGCISCPSPVVLVQSAYERLIELLAYLTETYNIPVSSSFISFHEIIECDLQPECSGCRNLSQILQDIAEFCTDCAFPSPCLPTATSTDNLVFRVTQLGDACNNVQICGCEYYTELDQSMFADLILPGDIAADGFVGLNSDGELVSDNIDVAGPLVGQGIDSDPLALDPCLFESWLGSGTLNYVVGLDDSGCLIRADATLDNWFDNLLCSQPENDQSVVEWVLAKTDNTCPEWVTPSQLLTALSVSDTDCISLDFTNNVISATPILSPDAGNSLECLANGLFSQETTVNAGDDCLSVVDNGDGSFTVSLVLAGQQGDVENAIQCLPGEGLYVGLHEHIAGDGIGIASVGGDDEISVNLDPDSNNTLQLGPDGLLNLFDATSSSDCLTLTWDNISKLLTSDLVIDADASNLLECGVNGLLASFEVADTPCIDLDFAGNVLTANPVISGAITNISNVLTCEGTGIFVPRGASANVNGPLTGTGSDTDPLDIDFGALDTQDLCDFGNNLPIATLTNLVGTDGDGCLRQDTIQNVIAQGLEVIDTDCINLTLTDNVLQADLIVPSAIGVTQNILSCQAEGLFVPLGGGISTVDGFCVGLTLTSGVITAELITSPPQGGISNILSCTSEGAFVPLGAGLEASSTSCIDLDLTGGLITATPILAPTQGIVQNVLDCLATGLYVPLGAGISALNSDCITLSFNEATGELQADILISALANNGITCEADGLYVNNVPTLTVVDTNSIDLTYDIGTGTLSADAEISTDPDNILTEQVDGLQVLLNAVVSPCISLTYNAGSGELEATPILSPNPNNILTCEIDGMEALFSVQDTSCIDLTFANGVLSANPIISAIADNQISCELDGLYVPQFALTVNDTSCITLDITGDVLTASPIISPDANNILTCETDGFEVLFNPVDTNGANLTYLANGDFTVDPIISPDPNNALTLQADGLEVLISGAASDCISVNYDTGTGEITATPIISANPVNILECDPDGFFVPTPFITGILDSNCLNLDVTGGILSINPIISPLPDNTLVCQGDGLYVPPLIAIDSNCLDIEITGGTITVNPVISVTPENALQCLGDGFFVQECCPLVTDTQSVDLTLTGLRTISADVIIDPDLNNQLVLNPGGLFVAEPFITDVADHQCLDLDVTSGILTVTPIIDPAANNLLTCGIDGLLVEEMTVVDGNCIDLDITGNTISAEIIVSAQANNIVQCLGDGLFAEAPILSVDDTDCITLTLNTGVLTADPIIDPDLTNQLTCGANGLFVPEPLITAIADTNCIDLTEAAGVLTANPILSATADNQIQCLGDGLYVPDNSITVSDTDCIALALDGANNLTATPIIDPALDNQLVCTGTGLYVPEPAITAIADTNCIDLNIAGGVLTANPILSVAADNTLQCLGDGLYVPECCPLVVDTQSVDLTLTGTRTISADVIIDPDLTNQLALNAGGLFVPEPAITSIADTLCIDLDNAGGVLTATPIIDPAADNTLICGGNGLYVPSLVVNDTNCIDLTLTAGVLTADPIISAIVDNQVQCLGDGFYVPIGAGTSGIDTDCLSTTVTNGVVSVDPILAPTQAGVANALECLAGQGLYVPAGAGLAVIDGNCVDLTLTNGSILQAEVIIDPAADNLITCGLNGLLAQITAVDTNCVDLTFANGILQADIIVAPGPVGGCENALVCDATGLFVPELQVLDTNCINLTLDGCVLSADPIIAPDGVTCDNALVCQADGLFVPELQFIDSDCIDFTVTNGCEVTAVPIIDPAVENCLVCNPTGLYVSMNLEFARLNGNPGIIIDDTTGPEGVWFDTGLVLPFTMTKDGNVNIDFSHHLRAITAIANRINVLPGYSIDGGAVVSLNMTHAFDGKDLGEEQHMSANGGIFLTAGAHNIRIHYLVGDQNLVPGESIDWNQTEIRVTWIECA